MCRLKVTGFILIFFLNIINLKSQILINEVSSNNFSFFKDGDGEFVDWIELFNAGSAAVNLKDYKLSDRKALPAKWTFPNVNIPAGGYVTVFASGKNKFVNIDHWESAVVENDLWRYLVPSAEISGWTNQEFDDSSWLEGRGGIGRNDGDDSTIISGNAPAFFMRHSFNIVDVEAVHAMVLHLDFDDGFVAYINGKEIARSNNLIGFPPSFNALTNTTVEAFMYQGGLPSEFIIPYSTFKSLLKNGTNVLAIQIHNQIPSGDLSARPFLTLGIGDLTRNYRPTTSWFIPPAIQSSIHTNFSLKASGETVYLFNPSNEVINSLVLPALSPDDSYGRLGNGSAEFRIFNPPSPNASNDGSKSYLGYLNSTLNVSVASGFYTNPQSVSCTCSDPTAEIRYTRNGAKPSANSLLYSTPLYIDSTIVLRAACFKAGYKTANFETNTYFINDPGTALPIFSISTHPNNLFSQDSGIYVLGPNASPTLPYYGANFWQEWEREVHIEYFDKGKVQRFEQDCGIQIFGGYSRASAMKSVRLIPDGKYGANKIKYPLFSERPEIKEFDQVHLRNGGNDFNRTHLRDQVNNRVLNSTPSILGTTTNMDYSAYEPVVVFINGVYWGVHQLRERYNHGYLESHHKVKKDEFEMCEMEGDVIKGSNTHFLNLVRFVAANDMTVVDNYNKIKSWLDIENYVDYFAAQIYHNNHDWPHNNIKYWRKTVDGKWRFLYYDTDFGLAIFRAPTTTATHNELNRVIESTKSRHSRMFKKLLTNPEFKDYFVNRMADLMNTIYTASNYKKVFNELKSELNPEMPRHLKKWPSNSRNVDIWNSNCEEVITWMDQRPENVRAHILAQFSLVKQVNVTLQVYPEGAGVIKISTIAPTTYPWTGIYYDGVPVTITAIPNPGFTFTNWTSSSLSLSDPNNVSNTLNIGGDNTFTANFSGSAIIRPSITISEINYNSSKERDTGDWFELYNYGNSPVDISNWVVKDDKDDNVFSIPEGTVLGANEYIVVANDIPKFTKINSTVSLLKEPFNFNLSSSGDQIRLYDEKGELYLSMAYSDAAPWPKKADGEGATLELIDPLADLSDGSNWQEGCIGGSPGKKFTECSVETGTGKDKLKEDQIVAYPNPFREKIYILISTKISQPLKIEVTNLLGVSVYSSSSHFTNERITFGDQLPSGEYFVHARYRGRVLSSKIIKTR